MPGPLVQIFRARQSSDEGLLFCAAKFFHTRRPEGSVKFGNLDTGGLLEGQSLQSADKSRHVSLLAHGSYVYVYFVEVDIRGLPCGNQSVSAKFCRG